MARGKRWTAEDRQIAAWAYATTGGSKKASKLTGIPDRTIRDWTTEDWWPHLLENAHRKINTKLVGRYTGIAEAALEKLADRIEKGDAVLDKQGKIVFKPVSAKDLILIGGLSTDKRAVLRGEPTSISARSGTTKEHLKKVREGLVQVQKEAEEEKETVH